MRNLARAIVACAIGMTLAVPPAEARPRDPFSALVAGIGKAFAGDPARRSVKRYVARKAKPVKVARRSVKAVPEITVKPALVPNATSGEDFSQEYRGEMRDIVVQYARLYGIDPALAVALVRVESNFDPLAVGRAGEIGLVQIKCQTAREVGYRGTCRNLHHVGTNLTHGMKYLKLAMETAGGNACHALTLYNQGIHATPGRSAYCTRIMRAKG